MVQQAAVYAGEFAGGAGRGGFLGEYLSAPKPANRVSRPRSPRVAREVRRAVPRPGPAARTCAPGCMFGSGSSSSTESGSSRPDDWQRFLARLADERVLPPGERPPLPLLRLLHDCTSPAGFASESAHE